MTATNADWIQHPGVYIKAEMEERGWIQRDLAFILGAPETAVNMILSGKRGVTADMAKALADAFDVTPEFFANLQQTYDMARARSPYVGIPERRRMQTALPVREMIKRGWIEHADTAMLEEQLARFFGARSVEEIPYMPHAAKRSRYEECQIPPAQTAWLFRVRQIAASISVPQYSANRLRAAIQEFMPLLLEPEGVRSVPRILADCGVRFVIVEKLPGAEIDGVCFWLNEFSPVIGVTTRRDTIDNFWFVVRHEVEHVLRGHGRDREIIDDLAGEKASPDVPSEEERVANAAAGDFCAPTDKLNEFMVRKRPFFYERDVLSFARLHLRHPGLVVGQMQFRMKNYGYLTRHLTKVRHIVLPGSIADGWGQTVPVSL